MSIPEPNDGVPTGNPFLRFAWMFVGPMSIALLAVLIASEPAWQFSIIDATFWSVVALVVGARILDATRFAGPTADGSPSTPADLSRYAVGVGVLGVVAWVVARAIEI